LAEPEGVGFATRLHIFTVEQGVSPDFGKRSGKKFQQNSEHKFLMLAVARLAVGFRHLRSVSPLTRAIPSSGERAA